MSIKDIGEYKRRREYFLAYHKMPKMKNHLRKYWRQRRYNQRIKMLAIFGAKCVLCGFSDPRALQIDHINNDGFAERKKNSGNNYYSFFLNQAEKDIDSFLKRYQLLCANCNWIKKAENNEKTYRKFT